MSDLNTSGYEPVDTIVIVRPVKTQEKVGSLYLPDVHVERQQAAEQEGIIVAIGPSAFYDWTPAYRPRVGDRVYFGRYKQVMIDDPDQPKEKFWFLKDEDILAVGSEGETGAAIRLWSANGSTPQERAA